ncbi:peptidase G2 autoproteolytic cleavage domain-containing protein [Bacillus wiedmannii]|uniref:peptidase G2 autoproteolytic cleavage domain-containing protein n=1 Tax=Bacillus wiedmannii TaxID=1890302 RepID=UPI0015D4B217|nr:peptidase G2 autoproteolytic cleavage domain-containing protein [Bacillus wiedmannii]
MAIGNYSHVEGQDSKSFGYVSHAEGFNTIAGDQNDLFNKGFAAHAEGLQTISSGGYGSHSEGNSTQAIGTSSHAEGFQTIAQGQNAHSEGSFTQSIGPNSHAEGVGVVIDDRIQLTQACGGGSHAEGAGTVAGDPNDLTLGFAAHAEGVGTQARGYGSHAEGYITRSRGIASHAEGEAIGTDVGLLLTEAIGRASHAEGQGTVANGEASHTEGRFTATTLDGFGAHAEGVNTQAQATSAHAEGYLTVASGIASHAEGLGFYIGNSPAPVQAIGDASHTEGQGTIVRGPASHAEGGPYWFNRVVQSLTIAEGANSHAEGEGTLARGEASHSQGIATQANSDFSHAEGFKTIVREEDKGSHIMGQSGSTNESLSWFLVNGGIMAKISGNTGVGCFTGGTSMGPCDYAELFETIDTQPIDVGYFVTLEGEKIRKAHSEDDYILGITSATPGILGNSSDFEWRGKYLTDEWGRIQYKEVIIPEVINGEGKVITPERKEKQPMLNPKWNNTTNYIPRSERPEWVAVGLLGQLLTRDDGSCQVNGYCRPNDEGIATTSNVGYRVMKRTAPNQILVLFK